MARVDFGTKDTIHQSQRFQIVSLSRMFSRATGKSLRPGPFYRSLDKVGYSVVAFVPVQMTDPIALSWRSLMIEEPSNSVRVKAFSPKTYLCIQPPGALPAWLTKYVPCFSDPVFVAKGF